MAQTNAMQSKIPSCIADGGKDTMPDVYKRPPDAVKINAYEVAVKYAKDVLSGAIVAGKLVKLAAKRYIDDLAGCIEIVVGGEKKRYVDREREHVWDPDAAQHVVDFFGCLKHSKGEWGGQAFVLAPWQVFVLANLFGWYRTDGTRRFREAHIEIARKNGKSTFLAGIALYMLLADGEPGAEVYSAATKKDQAKIVFDESCSMRRASQFLSSRIQASRNNLSVLSSSSKFEPLSSDDNTLDGLNIHCVVVDELHAHPDRKLYDVLKEAMASRRSPLALSITTAGYNREGVCFAQRTHGEKILVGAISAQRGDSFFAYIACIDEPDKEGKGGDVWHDETAWAKANPSLGVSVKLSFLREAAVKAKEDPTALNSFLRKHLNVWTNQDVRWMPIEKWAACNHAGPLADARELRNTALEYLKGRVALGGLDLSSKFDLTAFALVFPPVTAKMGLRPSKENPQVNEEYEIRAGDPYWSVVVWFWLPEAVVADRVKKDRIPYDVWIREGFIETTSGNVVDQTFIRKTINALRKDYDIAEIAFDSWNATQLAIELQDDGFKLVEARQGFKTMSEPMKNLYGHVLGAELEHYGNPVLTWNAGNVAAEQDAAGSVKPDKGRSKEKIDGIVATIMAMSRVVANPNATGQQSVYNDRGIVFI